MFNFLKKKKIESSTFKRKILHLNEEVTLKKGFVVTLLQSYCDDKFCTEYDPCEDCVKMSNQFVLSNDVKVRYLKEVGDNEPYCI